MQKLFDHVDLGEITDRLHDAAEADAALLRGRAEVRDDLRRLRSGAARGGRHRALGARADGSGVAKLGTSGS